MGVAEQKRKAADPGDDENGGGGETKKMRTFNMKWLTSHKWLMFDQEKKNWLMEIMIGW